MSDGKIRRQSAIIGVGLLSLLALGNAIRPSSVDSTPASIKDIVRKSNSNSNIFPIGGPKFQLLDANIIKQSNSKANMNLRLKIQLDNNEMIRNVQPIQIIFFTQTNILLKFPLPSVIIKSGETTIFDVTIPITIEDDILFNTTISIYSYIVNNDTNIVNEYNINYLFPESQHPNFN